MVMALYAIAELIGSAQRRARGAIKGFDGAHPRNSRASHAQRLLVGDCGRCGPVGSNLLVKTRRAHPARLTITFA